MGAKYITMVDRKGILYKNRKDLNDYNQDFAVDTEGLKNKKDIIAALAEEAILNTFKDLKVDGRFVNVEVSNNPIGGGSSRGGGGFKGRSKGGSGSGSGFRSKERGGYKGGGSSRSDRPSRSTSSDRSDSGRRGSGDGGKSFGGSPFSENKNSKRRNGFM